MDIAIALSLAVVERTLQTCLERQEQGQSYAAYPLRGGCELWSVRLSSHSSGSKISSTSSVPTTDLLLSWQGGSLPTAATVNLAPSGKSRLRQALNNVCRGFELSFSKPVAWAASGALTCALALVAGNVPTVASTALTLPTNDSKTVQCCLAENSGDKLLATVSQPARHRVFSRARGGVNGHTDSVFTRTDDLNNGKNESGRVEIIYDPATGAIKGSGAYSGHLNTPVHFNSTAQNPEGQNVHRNISPNAHLNLAPDSDGHQPSFQYHCNNGSSTVTRVDGES